jgi:lipopolysaccharide/colanic/teichoic acid biosynthesis glycosyltransferase
LFQAERYAAAAALVLAAPLLGAAMAVVRVLSGRSPLVAHRRIGLGGEPLWVLKLRTMWEGVGREGGWVEWLDEPEVPPVKRGLDPRVTSRFAAFCRRHSIDELPQLWHVVQGRMRLVGPRPMTQAEVRTCYGADAGELLAARPGLTGLWQVMGRNRRTDAQRRRLDLLLVRRCSAHLYAWILWRTALEVVAPKDAC